MRPGGRAYAYGVRVLSHRNSVSRSLGLTLAVLASQGCVGVDIPEGPEMDELEASYVDPRGTLPHDDVEALMTGVQAGYSQVEAMGGLDIISSSLEPVSNSLEEVPSEKPKVAERIEISGYTEVTRLCPGDGGSSSAGSDGGKLTYNLTIKKNALQEVLWGEFEDCGLDEGSGPARLNGSWSLSLGQPQSIGELGLNWLLFSLDGTLESDDETVPLVRSYRLSPDGTVELSFPAENGDVVFGFQLEQARAFVRTSSDSYCCDFEAKECFAVVGEDCDSADAGGERITW